LTVPPEAPSANTEERWIGVVLMATTSALNQ
jgi:hypothetical protein